MKYELEEIEKLFIIIYKIVKKNMKYDDVICLFRESLGIHMTLLIRSGQKLVTIQAKQLYVQLYENTAKSCS